MSVSRLASLATPRLHVKSVLEASPGIVLQHVAALRADCMGVDVPTMICHMFKQVPMYESLSVVSGLDLVLETVCSSLHRRGQSSSNYTAHATPDIQIVRPWSSITR